MNSSVFKVPTRFEVNQVITLHHPKLGRVKAKVINNEYLALTGHTVVLIVDNYGLMNINEKFLLRILV